jgi:hypothetical protein
MKILIKMFLFLIILSFDNSAQDTHKIYDELLTQYVENGLVDYEKLKDDNRLQKYLDTLSNINPDTFISDMEKMSFWINAYNAFTLKVIVDNYPLESINDLNWGGMAIAQLLGKTIWHQKFIIINDKEYSLNDIEHSILRGKFNDPRIHFALVCAALSCPKLRPEAYTADKLNVQLEEQGRLFLNNQNKNKFDLKTRTAYLSRYFDWYKNDFGKGDKEVLLYITRYLNDEAIINSIKDNPENWTIEYVPYNWCLNVKGAKITDNRCVTDWDSIKGWFLGLGDKYNVNPWIFGGIYIGAIPFFTFCVGWIIRNYKKNKSIVLPSLLAGFFFISAYLYLIIAGENVPWWVYGILILMIIYGIISTINKIKHKVEENTV